MGGGHILLLSISDITKGCLPKVLDGKVTVIKTPSSFEITMKKILNFTSSLTEEFKEANDTGKDFMNKHTCNISDTTTPRIDEVKEKDGNIVEKC
ncbi:unnamed protein product [Onchocerca ochengi]|uniref:SERPIN domain-containing protein n=2 Tax=Onchocerca TaxID=6281 RepID=A0A182E9F3_ONCOC|nr:unnamed protein product [Onchocerca ochengi]